MYCIAQYSAVTETHEAPLQNNPERAPPPYVRDNVLSGGHYPKINEQDPSFSFEGNLFNQKKQLKQRTHVQNIC